MQYVRAQGRKPVLPGVVALPPVGDLEFWDRCVKLYERLPAERRQEFWQIRGRIDRLSFLFRYAAPLSMQGERGEGI